MEKTVSERAQCPYCKNWDVYEAYDKHGKFGDWCPHCKKGIATEYEINSLKDDSKKYFNRLCFLLIFIYPLMSITVLMFLYKNGLIFYALLGFFMVLFSIFAGLALKLQNQHAIEIIKMLLRFLCLSPVFIILYHIIIKEDPSIFGPRETIIFMLIVGYFFILLFAGGIYLNLKAYLKTNEIINNTLIKSHKKKG